MGICCLRPIGASVSSCWDGGTRFPDGSIVSEARCTQLSVGHWFPSDTCSLFDCNFPWPFPGGFGRGVPLGACCDRVTGDCSLTVSAIYDPTACPEELGIYQGEREPCSPNPCGPVEPPYEFGCQEAKPDRPAGPDAPLWNRNLCQNMALEAFWANSIDVQATGDATPATSTRVRAIAREDGSESCRFHRGDLIVGYDGDAVAAVCGRPGGLTTDPERWSIAQPYVVAETDPIAIVVGEGNAAFVGSYRTPLFTEAIYHSFIWRCNEIPT